MTKSIHIIYYIWVNDKRNWKVIIDGQLEDIIKSNILEDAHLNIVLAANNDNLLSEATFFILNKINYVNNLTISLTSTLKNNFEYEGIKKLYLLANEEPEKLYIYLHSKGMFNTIYDIHKRSPEEMVLTRNLLNDWRKVKEVFKRDKYIVRAGLAPSIGGWVWFNFFWARGDYIRTCEEPKISNVRYYYESWLTTSIINEFDSYSLYANDKMRFDGSEATIILNVLKNKIK